MIAQNTMIGVRDPYGIRPLVIGKLKNSYVFTSETCALDIIGAKFIREVENGEIVYIENDLLKKSEQVPTDQEQHFLIEDLYKSVEKMEETQEMNMTNKVNIEFLRVQLDKALADIEDLKDKVRANGNGAH